MLTSAAPILSLCIPTYNRAELLERTLQSMVKETDILDKIEIVISDNASTDHTEKIGKFYSANYKNINYFRNELNIGGENNFVQCLSLGRGQYLKLINDYLEVRPGCLRRMVEIIESHVVNKEILFFTNGNGFAKKKELLVAPDLNAFLRITSYFITWIGCFGIWREDFDRISSSNKDHKTLQLYQTEVIFENFKFKGKAIVCNFKIFTVNTLSSKGGYNIFRVFVKNYFNTLILGLLKEGRINKKTYNLEKKRLLKGFVIPWVKVLTIRKDPAYSFDLTNMNLILQETYKNSLLYSTYKVFYLPLYQIYFSFFNAKRSKTV